MANINQIMVNGSLRDVKDSLSRPIIIDKGASSTITLPENLTLQGLVDEYHKGRPIKLSYNQRWYSLTDYNISPSYISMTLLSVNGTTFSYFSVSGNLTDTSVDAYGPQTKHIAQGTKTLISSALSRSTSSAGTGTIPTGYEQGFITMWGRPNAGNTGYMSVSIPIGQLSTNSTQVIFADDTNQITYNVTKDGSTIKFAFVSASSTTAAIDAVYITP